MKHIGRTVEDDYLVVMSEEEYMAFCNLSNVAAGRPMRNDQRWGMHDVELSPALVAICEFVEVQEHLSRAIEQLQTIKNMWEENEND